MSTLKSLLCAAATIVFLMPLAASAQTISIVSGHGQLTCTFCPGQNSFDPLFIVVKDASGAPMPNTTVNWATSSGTGTVTTATTVTDAAGQSSNTFFQSNSFFPGFGISYVQGTVTATVASNGSSVQFTETSALVDSNGINQVQVYPITVQPGTSISGQAGQQYATPLQVQVRTVLGGGVPGVAMRVLPVATSATTTVSCAATSPTAPGVVLSDATGYATCNLVFGGTPGSAQYQANVGEGFAVFNPFTINVTAGAAALIKVISGNGQSGNVGSNLPTPLLAQTTDLAGNPSPAANVVWDIPQGTATLTNARTSSDSAGYVSTNVTLGSTAGPVQIRVRLATNANISATFSANATVNFTGLQINSGNDQEAPVNTAFATPLTVQVTPPLAGVPVAFAVTSGSATLAAPSVTTGSDGRAAVTAQAGATAGPVAITATAGSFTQTFNLNVRPPGPVLTSNSFLNGAGYQPGFISPCSVATIMASGLAPGIQGVVSANPVFGPLPLQIANVNVQFGGSFAPLYSVANMNGQESVTVQVPCELPPGTVPVTVKTGTASNSVNIDLLAVSPGIFETVMTDGRKRAVLVKPDGSFVSLVNPARRNEIIRMFVTGIGPVTPPIGTNQVGIPGEEQNVSNSLVVGVNNAGVRLVSAKYAEHLIGIYEVAFEVPGSVPDGDDIPLALAVVQGANLVFGNPSAIPVR